MSSSRSRIDGIQRILQQWLSSRGMDTKFGRYRAWQFWDEAVGPQISARAKPVRMRGSVLEIRVDHPVWMQQLQLLKPRIVSRLNELLGETLIDDLFLRHGRITTGRTEVETETLPSRWQSEPLNDEEQKHIEETVTDLPDKELRYHIRHLMEMQMRLDKARKSKTDNE